MNQDWFPEAIIDIFNSNFTHERFKVSYDPSYLFDTPVTPLPDNSLTERHTDLPDNSLLNQSPHPADFSAALDSTVSLSHNKESHTNDLQNTQLDILQIPSPRPLEDDVTHLPPDIELADIEPPRESNTTSKFVDKGPGINRSIVRHAILVGNGDNIEFTTVFLSIRNDHSIATICL